MYKCDLMYTIKYWNLISFCVWIWHWKTAELFDFCITFIECDLFEILRLFADPILLSTTPYLCLSIFTFSRLQSLRWKKMSSFSRFFSLANMYYTDWKVWWDRFSQFAEYSFIFSSVIFAKKRSLWIRSTSRIHNHYLGAFFSSSAFAWRLLSKRQILAYVVNKTRAGQ